MTTVGFIGLGAMGTAITERLLLAKHTVYGWNRTQAKAEPLLEQGMLWADSPRAVAEAADVVFSMVFNDDALCSVVLGDDGILAGVSEGKIYADMSTVSPEVVRDLAPMFLGKGAYMLDSPVSGTPVAVRAGKLTFMVGGEKAAFEKIEPILLMIGPKATYIGESGLASVLKIALNLSIPVQLLAFFEGLLIAVKSGVDKEIALEVMMNSAISAPSVKARAPFAVELPEEPLFSNTGQRKDLMMALELGDKLNIPLNSAAATAQVMAISSAMGYADEDFGVMYKVLAKIVGLEEEVE